MSEPLDFISSICLKLAQICCHQNIDQTPVQFTNDSKKTLELVGKRMVHDRKSTNDTKRVTFAMTVTASGKILQPVVVFKGKPGGRIDKREFPTYLCSMIYACQENAWMDENLMLKWVEKVLKLYILNAPKDIDPILFLDSYRCHMMASVVGKIQELGVEVEHIPGRCTGLCQPEDVGVNKPFKNRIREQWESWMINEGLGHGKISPPTRGDIAKWTDTTLQTLPETIVRNVWRQ